MLPRLWGLSPSVPFRVPCNHPCSLMRADLKKLKQTPHWVSPKVDGVRMFLLFSFAEETDYAVFVNRAGKITPVHITAPPDVYSGTLLDGELVTHPETGRRTYLVFDAVAVNGYSMTKKVQSERMAGVVSTLERLTVGEVGLKVAVKPWFLLHRAVLTDVSASMAATPTDGFIFVPESGAPLHPGPQRDHYKWKPVSHHTIDMIWKEGELWIERAGVAVRATHLGVTSINANNIVVAEGCVVECSMSHESDGNWRASFVRLREDKPQPNDMRVASLTLQNIAENLVLAELE